MRPPGAYPVAPERVPNEYPSATWPVLRVPGGDQCSTADQLRRLDALATLGAVAASVTHELNNPLSYILASVETAAARLTALRDRVKASGAVDPDLVRALCALGDALEGADRVRSIVADVGSVARGSTGPIKLVDVHRVLDSAARIAAAAIRRHAELSKDYGTLPLVKATESRLLQVFINVLVNSAQAIAPGRPRENFVRVTTRTSPVGHAVIEITDSGSGIAPEDMPRVFEPFFTTKAGSGTGLGLALSRAIIRELGGDMSIESRPGAGARVAIALPPACASGATSA